MRDEVLEYLATRYRLLEIRRFTGATFEDYIEAQTTLEEIAERRQLNLAAVRFQTAAKNRRRLTLCIV
jgi:hypothetical protein